MISGCLPQSLSTGEVTFLTGSVLHRDNVLAAHKHPSSGDDSTFMPNCEELVEIAACFRGVELLNISVDVRFVAVACRF